MLNRAGNVLNATGDLVEGGHGVAQAFGASEKAKRGFTASYRKKHRKTKHGGCGCMGGDESFSGGLDDLPRVSTLSILLLKPT